MVEVNSLIDSLSQILAHSYIYPIDVLVLNNCSSGVKGEFVDSRIGSADGVPVF